MFVLCNVTINWLRLLRLVAPLLHWSSHEVLTTIFCWDPTHCMRVSAQSASTPTIRPTFLWTNRSLQKPFWIEIFLSLFMQKKMHRIHCCQAGALHHRCKSRISIQNSRSLKKIKGTAQFRSRVSRVGSRTFQDYQVS